MPINILSPELLDLSFEYCPPVRIPAAFPLIDEVSIFYYKHTILPPQESSEQFEEKAILVNLVEADGSYRIPAPKQAIDASIPPAKRTVLNRLRAKKDKQYLMDIFCEEQEELDAALCSHIQKNSIPVANSFGPYLIRRESGEIIVEFGLALIPSASVKYQKQNTALRFFARALNDESLVNPKAYTASPVELLRAITKEPSDHAPEIKPEKLRATLLPYQCESVEWCLKREGKALVGVSCVDDLDKSIRDKVVNPPLGWRKLGNHDVWVNPYLLKTSAREPEVLNQHLDRDAKGVPYYGGKGLLAEEMGLGKTLEITSLSILNPRPAYDHGDTFYNYRGDLITKSKATLVIVPRSILHQWRDEVKMHSPHLKCVVVTRDETSIEEIIEADMVFITYYELSKWLPVSVFKQKHRTRYNTGQLHQEQLAAESSSVDRSSLALIQFWRVVLDEVQMVSTGSSAAAQAARNVPRIHAWAVSGTPVKQTLEDLRGITYFLNLQPFVERPSWQRLISSSVDFPRTMSIIGLRHTKPMVAHQLYIPPQHRNLFLLKFSAVERARYNRIYSDFKRDAENPNCNLSMWLMRLRQAYFITVSGSDHDSASANASGTSGSGSNDVVALTLDEVLIQLVDEADAEVWSKTRDVILSRLEFGQLLDKADRMPEALALWKQMEAEISDHVGSVKHTINDLMKKRKNYEAELKQLKSAETAPITEAKDEVDKDYEEDSTELGPQYQKNVDEEKSFASREAKRGLALVSNRMKIVRVKLKSLQELLHRTYFFIATGYFRSSQRLRLKLGEDHLDSVSAKAEFDVNSAEETKYYNLAENVRNEILSDVEGRVEKLISKAKKMSFMRVNKQCHLPKAVVLDELSDFCEDISGILVGLLSAPLMEKQVAQSTAGIQLEEDYYSKTLDLQENSFVYLEALQMLLRDRAVAINGGTIQPRTSRIDSTNEELGKALVDKRDNIVEIIMSSRNRDPLYAALRLASGGSEADKLRTEIRSSQQKYTLLRDLYNARVEYYKQLQDISDQVTDVELSKNSVLGTLIRNKEMQIMTLEREVRQKMKNQTYLRTLGGADHSEDQQKDSLKPNDYQSNCIICFDPIKTGALAPCGHSFCAECLSSWLSSQKSCPLCKRPMSVYDVHTFVSGSGEQVEERTPQRNVGAAKLEITDSSISLDDEIQEDKHDHVRELFQPISNSFYNEILNIEIVRLYGVKIDMIVRLVKYLRGEDPSAQIIVFSQWLTVLKVLYTALTENGVTVASSTKLTNAMKADVNSFREDPEVACLLLHAKTDVAGLTLVNANHVLLCEPLMNTALELQAVSRINRIGQTRETYIWQFCVEDTVEQTILGATTRERMLQTVHVGSLDGADSSALAEAPSQISLVDRKSGAEIVSDNSLLRRILFKEDESSNEPQEPLEGHGESSQHAHA